MFFFSYDLTVLYFHIKGLLSTNKAEFWVSSGCVNIFILALLCASLFCKWLVLYKQQICPELLHMFLCFDIFCVKSAARLTSSLNVYINCLLHTMVFRQITLCRTLQDVFHHFLFNGITCDLHILFAQFLYTNFS